jgi:hypothetical protein
MLFGYPEPQPGDNWIHDCLVLAVRNVHAIVDGGGQLPSWPSILPNAYQNRLNGRVALKEFLVRYATALRGLSPAERQVVLETMDAQNRIPELLAGSADCQQLDDLPEGIRGPILRLFECAFGLLTSLGTRQRQYEAVCLHIPARVCPFCGYESLDAPGLPQEDLDHFLPRTKYPFAAANLRNLAPMGGRCNSSYKRAKDPLRGANGVRRISFDPFARNSVGISFAASLVNENSVGDLISEWQIDFRPFGEPEATWDDLFQVRRRWAENFDEKTVRNWLKEFMVFCKRTAAKPQTEDELLGVAYNYQQFLAECGFGGQAFLKAAAFEMLIGKCTEGSNRLRSLFWDLAGSPIEH